MNPCISTVMYRDSSILFICACGHFVQNHIASLSYLKSPQKSNLEGQGTKATKKKKMQLISLCNL